MQLVETMEEGPTQPQRSLLFKMFLLRDKGGQHKGRPSCVTRHIDVCWDPITAIARVLLASFAAPRSIASLLGENLYKVVLFSDSSDRTLSMSPDTLRKTVKKHQRMAGYCPPKLSTADGKPPKIKKLGLVLHGMRTKGGRRLANRLQGGWQELALYFNHETPGYDMQADERKLQLPAQPCRPLLKVLEHGCFLLPSVVAAHGDGTNVR